MSTPKAKKAWKAWNPSSITCAARNQGKKVATLRTSTYFYAGRPALGGLLHEQPTTSSPPSQHKNTFERQSRSHTAADASPSASRISLYLVSCLQLFRFRRVMCRSGGMASIPGSAHGSSLPGTLMPAGETMLPSRHRKLRRALMQLPLTSLLHATTIPHPNHFASPNLQKKGQPAAIATNFGVIQCSESPR